MSEDQELIQNEQDVDVKAEELAASQKLEKDTKERLNKVFGPQSTPDESSESTSEQSEEQTDKTEDPEQQSDESTSEMTDKSDEAEDSTSEQSEEQTDKTDDSKADDKSKLTDSEVRAALHLGWTKEDIEGLAKANPDLAKKTCAKALESTNNLSKRFAELGKKAKTPDVPAATTKKDRTKIDLSLIEKEYEGDPIVDVMKAVAAHNDELAAELDALKSSATTAKNFESETKSKQAEVAQDALVAQQIDVFFSAGTAGYEDFYGKTEKNAKNWDNLTQGQVKNRMEVVEQANQILLGAESQGMQMSLDEAFDRAHMLVTAPIQAKKIRDDIKKKVVKRSNSMTLVPSSSMKIQTSGKPTQTELESRTAQRLSAVFNK